MDCLKSFNFVSSGNSNFTTANGLEGWQLGANNHFFTIYTSLISTYNIEGFKNINIHGIDLIGGVSTLPTAPAATNCLVQDWGVGVQINGQMPLIGNTITVSPDQWALANNVGFNQNFRLGKYKTSVKFASPVQSVTSIVLNSLQAQGNGNESLTNINLVWYLNFVVYYSFEGE
jgi:hypothetical protein